MSFLSRSALVSASASANEPPSRPSSSITTGMLTFTPYYHWSWEHSRHHATAGNLDRRGGTLVGEGIFDFAGYARRKGMFSRSARSRIVVP